LEGRWHAHLDQKLSKDQALQALCQQTIGYEKQMQGTIYKDGQREGGESPEPVTFFG
jgi:hypothetical protein